jgi:hypothetical protein
MGLRSIEKLVLETLQFTLSAELKDILTGLILGDLYCEKQKKTSVNARLRFTQGIVHTPILCRRSRVYRLVSTRSL